MPRDSIAPVSESASPSTDARDDPWSRALGGDADARTWLIARAWALAGARLGRLTADQREEIRQEIAESVLRALATGLAATANLDAFLAWRGRAEITEFLRRRGRADLDLDPGDALHLAGMEPSPFERAAGKELRGMIEACLRGVPNADHRAAWAARYLEGLEPRQIAAAGSASAETVRTWIARAARSIRSCLEHKLAGGTR